MSIAIASSNLQDAFLSTAQTLLDVSNTLVTTDLYVNDLEATTVNIANLDVNILRADDIVCNTINATEINCVDLNVQEINGVPYIPYKGLSGISFLTINYDTSQALFVILNKNGTVLGTEPDVGAAINTATTFLTVGRTYNQTIKVQSGRYALTTQVEMADNMTLDLTEVELYSVDGALTTMIHFDTVTRSILKGGTLNSFNSAFATQIVLLDTCSFCKLMGVTSYYGLEVKLDTCTQSTISNCKINFSNFLANVCEETYVTNTDFISTRGPGNRVIFGARTILSNNKYIDSATHGCEIISEYAVLENLLCYQNQAAGIIVNAPTPNNNCIANCSIINNGLAAFGAAIFTNTMEHSTFTNMNIYCTPTAPVVRQQGFIIFGGSNNGVSGGTYHDNNAFQFLDLGAATVFGTNITVQ